MDLVPYMYFERQEAGSQLCAQHCLNNLLQAHNYTEFDLADVARRLDDAENAALAANRQNKKSFNYDDTGFFSISVLERALEVWDLTLVRWRGEAMRQYQDHPEEQSAFILNLASHWLPLRRFGPFPPHANAVRRWYNMNSFLAQPEWISPTYLRMVLEQAEKEGYSVFVVRKAGRGGADAGAGAGSGASGGEGRDGAEGEGVGWMDGGVAQMPESEADAMAVHLGEPVGRTGTAGAGGGVGGAAAGAGTSVAMDQVSIDTDPDTPPAGPSSPLTSRRRRQADVPSTGDQDISDDPFIAAQAATYREIARARGRPAAGTTGAGLDTDADLGVGVDDDADADVYADATDDAAAFDFLQHQRSYDDEDAALQAALRASMEDVPKDWVAPDLAPKPMRAAAPPPAPTPAAGAGGTTTQRRLPDTPGSSGVEDPGLGSVSATQAQTQTPVPAWRPAETRVPVPDAPRKGAGAEGGAVEEEEVHSPMEELSADEIRRRRLARFNQ